MPRQPLAALDPLGSLARAWIYTTRKAGWNRRSNPAESYRRNPATCALSASSRCMTAWYSVASAISGFPLK